MTITLISLALGGFIAMMIWQVYHLFRVVPQEDRQFMDRPALGFRLVWPLIRLIDHHFGHWFSTQQRQITAMKLTRGGVEYSLSPEQFMAARFVAALGFALVAWVLLARVGDSVGLLALVIATGGYFYPDLWLRETTARRQNAILRALPFYLDIITLSVEAGSNLTGGMTQAVQKSADSPLRREFSRVLRDIRSGKNRADALRDLSERSASPAVTQVVSSLIQAERTGSSLGPLLRAQADQLRSRRFQKAEKQAMEAPVKLLGPLVMFIFPTTFLVLGFLILSKAIQGGIIEWAPVVWAYTWPG